MFVVDGADNVYCKRDMCRLFSLMLVSLDSVLALTFSLMGMYWTHTRSKADWMTLQTR